ncbi:MAG: ribose-5-phosphate isomerase RpiA [Candidatus Bathyarchaeota archaeon]|nr:ribose-5-phosphate isomerase RpiA [Candidatus Bathyarchaeota archaeon]
MQASPDAEKRNAAYAAVDHVKDGMVVGLGSGTTAAYAILALGERRKHENMQILGVPSSYQAFQLAIQNGVPITTLEENPIVDVNIDGADQIDPQLNLIKGMGAALVREKIVAASARHNIFIADQKKKVLVLGEGNQPVPLEVVPFGVALVRRRVQALGGIPMLRETKGKLGPVISDNGNVIMDAAFGAINDPEELELQLKKIPGVVETGLFLGLSDVVYLGTGTTVQKLEKNRL